MADKSSHGAPAPEGHQPELRASSRLAKRNVISLSASCAGGALVLDPLVLEVMGPEEHAIDRRRLRCRLGNLVETRLTLHVPLVAEWLAPRLRSPDKALSTSDVRLRLSDQRVTLTAQWHRSGQAGYLYLSGCVEPWAEQLVRLEVDQLFVLGPAPAPAPLVIATLLTGLGAAPSGDGGPIWPLARVAGSTRIYLDVLGLALLEGLPPQGWRIPLFSSCRLQDFVGSDATLELEYAASGKGVAEPKRLGVPPITLADPTVMLDEKLERDAALASAEELRQAIREHPDDAQVWTRVLQWIGASPLPGAEARELVAQARARGCSDQAWVAEAALCLREDDAAGAARCYRGLADLGARTARPELELVARLEACRHAPSDEAELALADVERALEIDSSHAGALQQAARLSADLGRWERLAQLRQRQVELTTADPERSRLHLALAELYRVHLARPHRAIEHYRAALSLQPRLELALSGLAACCIDVDESSDAIDALDQLATLAMSRGDTATEIAALLRAASLLEHGGQPERALHRLERLRAAGHVDAQLSDRLADLLLRMGRYEDVLEVLRCQLEAETEPMARAHWEQRLDQVNALLEERARGARATTGPMPAGEQSGPVLERAQELPVDAVSDRPASPADEAAHWRSVASALRNKCKDVTDGPPAARLRLQLAQVLDGKLGETAEALPFYAEAVTLDPGAQEALRGYADACFRLEHWRRAQALYTKLDASAEVTGPAPSSSAELACRMGLIEEALGDREAAGRWFNRALELEPQHIAALEEAARLAALCGDTARAIVLLDRLASALSVEELGMRAEVRERLAAAHLDSGDADRARVLLEGALQLEPRRIESARLLRETYIALGDHRRVVELTERLVRLSSNASERAALLCEAAEVLATRLDDEEGAIECLLRALDIAPDHEPTIWRLIDCYWNRADLRAVAELGSELRDALAVPGASPNLRHARIAIATLLAGGNLPDAARWLRPALTDEDLARRALLELASIERLVRNNPKLASEQVVLGQRVAALIRQADDSGQIWRTLEELEQAHPQIRSLAGLVREAQISGDAARPK